MADNFSDVVMKWVTAEKERHLRVFRETAQRTIQVAQDIVPVVTGYLRWTGTVSLGEPGLAVTYPPDGPATFKYDAGKTDLKIAAAGLDDVIYFVWTANYAPYVEANRGFVRLAGQQFPQILNAVAIEAAARSGK